jgi:hypothetical protein
VALFAAAALMMPCGVIHSWCSRSPTAVSAGPGGFGSVWLQARLPLTACICFCSPVIGMPPPPRALGSAWLRTNLSRIAGVS